ncbi:hypothetical protein H5410_046268 [Solanum commersonii]|uniref:DUF4283 domain-containing protein n=1 Tax=Solanum commersonii TaxID=4109 RepID=A0A9J5XDP9_SOLCO|nr:hypothetical protein H5410_046268 [Solanum commersonii]
MTIEGKLMRIRTWTPNLRPEKETPIVPIWVLLPGLPWHCFKKEVITPLLEYVGKVLYLDTASIKRTRANIKAIRYMNTNQEQEEKQHQNNKEGNNQQQPEQQKEEEWQVQRRRNNKPQEEKIQTAVWRPTPSQNRLTKEHPQNTA